MSVTKTLKIIIAVGALMLAINLVMDSSKTGLNLLNTAIKMFRPYDVTTNIAFGNERWQTLDVYKPSTKFRPSKSPVIVFVYGGGWSWGDKSLNHFAADAFTSRGYTVVIPDYIKYPDGKFPQFIEDVAMSIAWVQENITSFNGDPQNLYLVGHSAGAHTVALLGADKHYLNNAGVKYSNIKGIAGIAGPYNFTPKKPAYIDTFGKENFEIMKVSSHIDGSEPPMLLLHADGDTVVGKFNQTTLAEIINAKGGIVETIDYDDDITHVSILLKLHPWFAGKVDVAADIDNFFNKID